MNGNPNLCVGVRKTRIFNLIDALNVRVDNTVRYTSLLHDVLESQSSEQLWYVHGYSLPRQLSSVPSIRTNVVSAHDICRTSTKSLFGGGDIVSTLQTNSL
jgi:hypothetical protein